MTLRVSVSTDVGTLSLPSSPSGLTLAAGFTSWSGTPEIAFTGVSADVNAALASLTISPGSTTGVTAHIQINAQPFVSGLVYAPENGHYYQYFADTGVDFDTARAAALTKTYGGQSGYLATIPSSAVNDMVAERIPGASNVWFGGLATNDYTPGAAVKRTWEWVDGPLAGTDILKCSNLTGGCSQVAGPWPLAALWASGEPNNYGDSETAAVTNWGSVGEWNDLPQSGFGGDGYVVEYGDLAVGSSTPFTGTAAASADVSVVGPAGPPTGVTATTHGGKATVSWTPPSNNGGRPIASYTATASGGGGSCTVAAPATNCTIEGLTIGGNYSFTVTADNGLGSSGSSTASSPVTPTVAAPEPASDPVATLVDPTSVRISWTPTSDDGGEPVTYTVTAQPGGATCTSSAGSCVIGGLTPGQSYSFSVTASNSAGAAAAVSAAFSLPGGSASPLLTDVRFASHKMRVAKRKANLLASAGVEINKRKRSSSNGVKLGFTASESGTLKIQLVRDMPGRMRGGKCRKRKGAKSRRNRCTIARAISTSNISTAASAGANTLRFTGWIGSKRLQPGLYHLKLTLVDADGNSSNTLGDWVRIVSREAARR